MMKAYAMNGLGVDFRGMPRNLGEIDAASVLALRSTTRTGDLQS